MHDMREKTFMIAGQYEYNEWRYKYDQVVLDHAEYFFDDNIDVDNLNNFVGFDENAPPPILSLLLPPEIEDEAIVEEDNDKSKPSTSTK